jgi:parvulin-like peptidyl-prolyl isomerase
MHKVKTKNSEVKIIIKNLKFYILCCIFVFYAFSFALTCFGQDKIVAIVNNDVITQKDLSDFVNFMRVQLAAEYKGEELENKIQSMKLDLLDKLIEDRLILQEAKKNDIKIDDSRIRARIDEIRKRYASDMEFQEALDRQGLVQADLELRIREQILMYNIIDMKIRSKILIKPAEITDFYQKNTQEFILPQQREFQTISIGEESLAKEIYNNLKSGQELQDLAKKYSLSVNKIKAEKGGQLRKDIEEIVFKMNPGDVSQPTQIEDQYYIFRLDNIIPPTQQSLSEVQDKIHAFLFNKKMQEEMTKWLDELKVTSYIKILQD